MTVKEQMEKLRERWFNVRLTNEQYANHLFLLGARTALEAAASKVTGYDNRRAIRSLAEHPERLLGE